MAQRLPRIERHQDMKPPCRNGRPHKRHHTPGYAHFCINGAEGLGSPLVNRILTVTARFPADLGDYPRESIDPLSANAGNEQIRYGFFN
jgi:hypothetical protein